MTNERSTRLKELFNALRREEPDIATDATLLDGGTFGIVVDHGDNTVSKFFLRDIMGNGAAHCAAFYANEIGILTLLNGQAFAGIATPALVDYDELPWSQTFRAHCRMSKIPGRIMFWDADTPPAYFSRLGTLLAAFHEEAQQLKAHPTPGRFIQGGTAIPQTDSLDRDTNRRLAACDAYFQDHMAPGIVHGDLRARNLLAGSTDGTITGLIDFSMAGYSPNGAIDFALLSASQLALTLKTYEARSGTKVDATQVAMTLISQMAVRFNLLSRVENDPCILAMEQRDLFLALEKVRHVTDLTRAPTPQALPSPWRPAA